MHGIESPDFVWICGAVGSGNTLMFRCLTQDGDVYGVNEDALASTLERLVKSEVDMGACPHATEAFVEFMYRLRHDRKTLVLKTPANIRFVPRIEERLPKSRFITMIREPHAAIVSGLARHDTSIFSVKRIAERWREDCRLLQRVTAPSLVVNFDDFVHDPVAVLKRVDETILPLSPAVTRYATSVSRPGVSDPDRWKGKVDDATRAQIESCVRELELIPCFEDALAQQPVFGRRESGSRLRGDLMWLATHGRTLLRRLLHRGK